MNHGRKTLWPDQGISIGAAQNHNLVTSLTQGRRDLGNYRDNRTAIIPLEDKVSAHRLTSNFQTHSHSFHPNVWPSLHLEGPRNPVIIKSRRELFSKRIDSEVKCALRRYVRQIYFERARNSGRDPGLEQNEVSFTIQDEKRIGIGLEIRRSITEPQVEAVLIVTFVIRGSVPVHSHPADHQTPHEYLSIGGHLYPVPDNFEKWATPHLRDLFSVKGHIDLLLRNIQQLTDFLTKGVESYLYLALKAQISVADHLYCPATRQRVKTFLPGNKLHESHRSIANDKAPRERITISTLKEEGAFSYKYGEPTSSRHLTPITILKNKTSFNGHKVPKDDRGTFNTHLENSTLLFRVTQGNFLTAESESFVYRAAGIINSQDDHRPCAKRRHFRPQRASNRSSHPGALHDKHPFASGQCAISALYVNRCLHIQHCDSSDFIDDIDIEISAETCLSETIEDHLPIENTEAHIWARREHNLFGSRAEV